MKDFEELLERKKSWKKVLQVSNQKKARENWDALGLFSHIPKSSFLFAHCGNNNNNETL